MGGRAVEKARKEPMANGTLYKIFQPNAVCILDTWWDLEAELREVVISRSLSEAGLHRTVSTLLWCCFSFCDLTQVAVNSLILRVRLLLISGEETDAPLHTPQTFFG